MLVFQQERHVIERGEQWAQVRRSRKGFERLIGTALAEAGGLSDTDHRIALSALLGMVNHTAQWHRRGGRISSAEIADAYVGLVLDWRGATS